MTLFVELNDLISKYRFFPKKGSGIHFIIKKDLIEEMLSLGELKKSDKVLEVFAGEFFLARKLSKKSSLTLLENREQLLPILKKQLPKTRLISSFSSVSKNKKCVSFLPSENSSETFSKLIFLNFDLMVLLLQRDFALKILAEPGFSEYGSLSVLINTFFEVKEVKEVKSDSFFPPTSSDFLILKLEKKKKTEVKSKKDFSEFLKVLFRFKNKTCLNALEKALPLMELEKKKKEKIKRKIKKIEFEEKVYLTETEEFIELFNFLTQ